MKAPVFVAVVLLAMAFLALGATDPAQRHDDSVARLEDRISALEHRVKTLESKLQSTPPRRRAAPVPPERTPRSQHHPKGWRRKEFNGIPYYIIPVERKPGQSTRRTR